MNIQPCPYCQQPPALRTAPAMPGLVDEHYLECSNQIDCPGWPYTEPHPTQELAIADWNAITKEGS
jgi:hypothetical protein